MVKEKYQGHGSATSSKSSTRVTPCSANKPSYPFSQKLPLGLLEVLSNGMSFNLKKKANEHK